MFFPVFNQVFFNSPNCAQGSENLSAKYMRKVIGDFIDSVRVGDLSVELDSRPIPFQRVQSDVFAVTLPAGNIFGECAPGVPVPPGVYSPAVDDGYYAKLDNLSVGDHTLRIRVTAPFQLDVTYHLVVVKVSDK